MGLAGSESKASSAVVTFLCLELVPRDKEEQSVIGTATPLQTVGLTVLPARFIHSGGETPLSILTPESA